MNFRSGDFTVGDVGVAIEAVAETTLSGTIQFIFIKPSGKSLTKTATVSGVTATYIWQTGDLDEDGDWRPFVRNASTGYWYRENGAIFNVRPTPEVMARSET